MTEKEKFVLLQRGIEIAKELQDKATEAEDLIYEALSDLGINPAKYLTSAKGNVELSKAISTYIKHGKYSVDWLMQEIHRAYRRK